MRYKIQKIVNIVFNDKKHRADKWIITPSGASIIIRDTDDYVSIKFNETLETSIIRDKQKIYTIKLCCWGYDPEKVVKLFLRSRSAKCESYIKLWKMLRKYRNCERKY